MADETTQVTAPDFSISQLRTMAGNNWEPPAETPAKEETAAPAAEESAETAPDSGTETHQEQAAQEEQQETSERDEQGRFAVPAGVQKRIDKAVRAQREAERRAADAEARLSAQQQGNGTPAQPKPETAAQTKPAGTPKPEDYPNWDAYEDARINYAIDQRDQARAQQQAQRKAEEDGRAIQKSWSESETATRKAHADYDDTLSGVTVQVPRELQIAILRTPEKAELAYQLAKQPAELARIAALPYTDALVELGAFRASLKAAKAEAPKPKTPAKPLPKPPAVVGGSGATAPAVDLNTCDMRTFKREARKLITRDEG